MAYADNALAPDERARLDALLATDAILRARLEPFVLGRTGLSEIFGPVAQMPVPERLVSAVLSQDTSGNTSAHPIRSRRSWAAILVSVGEALFTVRMMLVPIAVLSTAVIMVTVWLLSHQTDRLADATLVAVDDAGLYATGELALALEIAPSGKASVAKTHDGVPQYITPVLSFRSNDKRFCRQYKIESASFGGFAGLACRGDAARADYGTWRVIMHAQASPRPAAPGTFRPAAAPQSPSVDAAVTSLIDGDVLGPNDEAELIGNAWRREPGR